MNDATYFHIWASTSNLFENSAFVLFYVIIGLQNKIILVFLRVAIWDSFYCIKETKSATMNIFRKFLFSF